MLFYADIMINPCRPPGISVNTDRRPTSIQRGQWHHSQKCKSSHSGKFTLHEDEEDDLLMVSESSVQEEKLIKQLEKEMLEAVKKPNLKKLHY